MIYWNICSIEVSLTLKSAKDLI